MNTIARYGVRILLASVILLVFALYLGCGSKETAETPATQETAAQAPPAAGDQQTPSPQTAPGTADWAAAYDNPKLGICPVCKMSVQQDHAQVASIGEKTYACCSENCAKMLAESPDKYLTEEASEKDSHEGHGH